MPYAPWHGPSVRGHRGEQPTHDRGGREAVPPLGIRREALPGYGRRIKISAEASFTEMIAPGALAIPSPLVAGPGFDKNACAGLLSAPCVQRAAGEF